MRKASTLDRLVPPLTAFIDSGEAAGFRNLVTGVAFDTDQRFPHTLVAKRPDMSVLRVEGDSVRPFSGPGAVLVVNHMSAETLRAGLVTVSTNRDNETVNYGLIESLTGWAEGGFNNDTAAVTPVTVKNRLGVVDVTFLADFPPTAPQRHSWLTTATSVALAAPSVRLNAQKLLVISP